MAWINAWERMPDKDGTYMTQGIYGVDPQFYTTDGGWNTTRDKDGSVKDDHKIAETHILRWLEADDPPAVPQWARDAWIHKTWKEFDDAF